MLKREQAIASFGRLVIALSLGVGIGTQQVYERHKTYWHQTIYRVQTVDFNLLAHTLSTKLSYALIKNQPEELQRTLDSNYSLFGLVVTDPSGKKIVTSSGEGTGQKRYWDEALDPQKLQKHHYDLLRDPPPLFPQGTYSDSYAQNRQTTKFSNKGQVIGRVYYVRGTPPTFQQDFLGWLNKPFSASSRFQVYTPTMLSWFSAGFIIWALSEWLYQSKRYQKQLALQREQELTRQTKDLNSQLQVQSDLISTLESEERQQRQQAQQLAAVITELQTQLEIEQREHEEILELAQEDLDNQSEQIRRLKQLEEAWAQKGALIDRLKVTLEDQEIRSRELEVQLQTAQNQKAQSERELEGLNNRLPSSSTPNLFEQRVSNYLTAISNAESNRWRILKEFNVNFSTHRASQFADFIVITDKCVITLEVKSHIGEIISNGDATNNEWYCLPNGDKQINSSGYVNPYLQVRTYTMSVLQRLRPTSYIPVYGVVVFPEGANVDAIGPRIDRYYRITTLENLERVLQDLEGDAWRRIRATGGEHLPRLTVRQIENLLQGRSFRETYQFNPLSS